MVVEEVVDLVEEEGSADTKEKLVIKRIEYSTWLLWAVLSSELKL